MELQELFQETRGQLQDLLDKRQRALETMPAVQGLSNDAGSAVVPGYANYVYVRIGAEEKVAIAFNNRTSKRNGLPVIVGYESTQPGLFQVLRERQVYARSIAGTGTMSPHHHQHQFEDDDGEDVVWIKYRQIVSGMGVYPSETADTSIRVATGFATMASSTYWYGGTSVDLAGYYPSIPAYHLYVLVSFGPSGVELTQGNPVPTSESASVPDLPESSYVALAAVLLEYGENITDWPDTKRIYELRQHNVLARKLSDLTDVSTASPSDGQVLTWSASAGVWLPQTPTTGEGGGGVSTLNITPRWHVDGPLAVVNEVDGVWRVNQSMRVEGAYLYIYEPGSAGSTIVDIDLSTDSGSTWSSIFSGSQPELAYDAGHVASAGLSGVILSAGDLLRANIDQVATGARGMTLQLAGASGENLDVNLLPTMGVA